MHSLKLKLKTLKKRKSTLKKRSNMKAVHKLKEEEIPKLDGDNINGLIRCILAFISGFFRLMNNIFSNFPYILWGICIVFALQTAMSHAAPSPINDVNTQTSLTTMLSSQDPSASFILYSVDAMESRTYTFQMDEIHQEAFTGVASSCTSIPILHELCLEHPASCQSTLLSIDNLEKP